MSREAMSFRCIASKQDSNTVLFVYQSDAHRQPWIFLTKRKAKFNDRRGLHFETTHTVSENDAFVAFRFLLLLLLHSISYGRTTTGADRKAINFTEKIDTKQNKRNEWQQPNNNREKKKKTKKRGEHSILWDFWNRKMYSRDLYSSLIGRRISIDRFWSIDWILAARTLAQHTRIHHHHSKWRRSTISVDDKNFLLGST